MVGDDDEISGATGDPARQLNRRYLAGLTLVALLQLINQVIVHPPILRLMTDAPAINLAGRQRMLSQRIAKAALAMEQASETVEGSRRRDELAGMLTLWTESHDRLLAENPSRPIRLALEGLQPFYERMRDAASHVLTEGDGQKLGPLLDAEAEYLPRMDAIVGMYEREAQAHVDWLQGTGWGLTVLTWIALAGVGGFVLRPAAELIERQVAKLQQSRDELEARVAERTRALQTLNAQLAREVADRTRAEEKHRTLVEQFSHVERTTAVGEMASGLAHELNQPLGAIANYTEGCLVALGAPAPKLDEVRAVLEKVLATTLRAGAIVQRTRRFVTRHGPTREPFDPNRLTLDVEEFFRDEARRLGTTVRLDLAPDLPMLMGDPIQVQQILVNLLRNALDALGRSQREDRSVIMATREGAEGDVEFLVSDNGEGIPSDRIGRVFDPYFSTRDEGMGMGLAISRTIVEAHHGRISVESEPGVRTTFRFILPVSVRGESGT